MKHKLIFATFLGVSGGIGTGLTLKNYTTQPWSEREIMYIKYPGELFVRFINSIILPLICSSIASASCNLSNSGPIGVMAFCYYLMTTSIGIVLSVILSQTIRPGEILRNENATLNNSTKQFIAIDTFLDLLRNLIPDNIVKACLVQHQTVLKEPKNTNGGNDKNSGQFLERVNQQFILFLCNIMCITVPIEKWTISHRDAPGTNVLGIVFFSLLLGLGLGKLKNQKEPLLSIIQSLSKVSMKIMNYAVLAAPVGTFFLIPGRILEIGDFSIILKQLGLYIITVFVGLILQGFVILPLSYYAITHKSPYKIIGRLGPALATAFGTSSSTATVPITIKCLQNIGINPKVLKFIVPIGATINMDGIALYETVGAIFIIQMRGLQFSLLKIIAISITCTISCIGAAGLPNGGYMMLIMVLNSVGVPVDDVALIIAIDCFVDRFRTTINIVTDALGSGIIFHLVTKNKRSEEIMLKEDEGLSNLM